MNREELWLRSHCQRTAKYIGKNMEILQGQPSFIFTAFPVRDMTFHRQMIMQAAMAYA